MAARTRKSAHAPRTGAQTPAPQLSPVGMHAPLPAGDTQLRTDEPQTRTVAPQVLEWAQKSDNKHTDEPLTRTVVPQAPAPPLSTDAQAIARATPAAPPARRGPRTARAERIVAERPLGHDEQAVLAGERPDASFLAGLLSPETRRAYQTDLELLAAFLRGAGLPDFDYRAPDLHLAAVTRDHLEAYRVWLQKHYRPATANRRLSVARHFFSLAMESGLLQVNPAADLKGVKGVDQGTARPLPPERLQALLDAIPRDTLPGLRDYAMIRLAARVGLRRAEVCALRVGDFHPEQCVNDFVPLTVRGKGNKRREVGVPLPVYHAVCNWLLTAGTDPRDPRQAGRPVFVRVRRRGPRQGPIEWAADWNRPLTTQAFWDVLQTHTRAAFGAAEDIDFATTGGGAPTGAGRLRPHDLRRYFITQALEHGARLERVQYHVGHADPRTTLRYHTRLANISESPAGLVDD
jgi:integrase/recombinase XerD